MIETLFPSHKAKKWLNLISERGSFCEWYLGSRKWAFCIDKFFREQRLQLIDTGRDVNVRDIPRVVRSHEKNGFFACHSHFTSKHSLLQGIAHCTGLGMAQSLSFFSSLRKSDSDENDDGANACAICLETMKGELATLSCGHVFHYTCVKRALAGCPACPVCRRKASPRSAIRLYLFVEARQKRSCKCKHRSHSTRQACREEALHNVLARSASELPERMKKMRVELDRINEIQRMTSSHSFQLENELARRQQQHEQTMRQIQHVQCELDRANVKLKRLQRIGMIALQSVQLVLRSSNLTRFCFL